MQSAAVLLLESDLALSEVARRVGYESEFAFSRAFKRYHGQPPGSFRRTRVGSTQPLPVVRWTSSVVDLGRTRCAA
jgi:AraC-like DNA-binding protein